MRRNKNGSITLSRRELYEQVWATPMARLAREYGLSDRGLAKICQRHGIPRPPRGYWAKRDHGHKVRQTPLPRTAEARTITLWAGSRAESNAPVQRDRKGVPTIEVPENLLDPDPRIIRTEKSLRSAKVDDRGLASPRAKRAFRVSVAKESIDRAMRILDTLVKELEELHFSVQAVVDDHGQSRTIVNVDEEEIEFHMTEKVRREERQLTTAELRDKKRNPWAYRRPEYRYLPTGALSLQIVTASNAGATRTWSDLKKSPLENRLGRFVAALEPIAEAIKRKRREDQERRKRWAEEEGYARRSSV